MAIAKQCYIRNISTEDQDLIKKASVILGTKTTPSTFITALEKFLIYHKQQEKNERIVNDALQEVKAANDELIAFKNHFSQILELEELAEQKKKMLFSTI